MLSPEDLIPDVRLREADVDAFGHAAIAARVADLAAYADPPVNIALFGAWGSGKSSFYELLRTEMKGAHPEVKPVRYDAWKYGGASLKRNFISNVANELGFSDRSSANRQYHRGLYENTRTVDFDPVQLVANGRWKSHLNVLAFSAAVTTIVLFVVAVFSSAFANEGLGDELARLAPGMFKFLLTALFAVLSAAKVLDGAKIEVQQTVPSEDERFAQLLKELVAQATTTKLTGRSMPQRLLFFVDELDRCSKADVVATLTSLRTFLDQPDCVFVVAADREVLEAALEEVEQATPVREHEPYYSSASAFLDKIFQHQFTLPPLRVGRLTGFARDLVAARGGLWKELRDAQPGGRLLNDVLYALIPAHVRSPRRVKVLLNNYATNTRVAEARGIEWRARATEIAKLTVLQTEFPRLAGDLHLEPRLPSLLLKPPDSPSDRQRLLLERHQLLEPLKREDDGTAEEGEDTEESAYETPDPLLAGRSNTVLKDRQHEDLLRYLRSRAAAGVPDPVRDLLYLEAAGHATGLDDIELSQLLEEEAANDPQAAIRALKDRGADERLAAARLLGQMSEREFGPERVNIMTALAGALESLTPDDPRAETGDLLANVRSFRAEEPLQANHLPGLLALALASVEGQDLRSDILNNPELIAAKERVFSIASLLPFLADDEATPVEVAVVKSYAADPEILLSCLRNQEAGSIARLLRAGRSTLVSVLTPTEARSSDENAEDGSATDVERAGDAGLSEADVRQRADSLLTALDERGEDLVEAQAELLVTLLEADVAATYGSVKDRADGIRPRLSDAATSNAVALTAISVCPAHDWQYWSGWIEPEERDDWLVEDALAAVTSEFESVTPREQETAVEVVAQIAKAHEVEAGEQTEQIATDLDATLASNSWWATDEAVDKQVLAYKFVQALRLAAPPIEAVLDDILTKDIVRAGPTLVAWDTSIATRVATLARVGPTPVLSRAAELVSAAEGIPLSGSALAPARVRLAAELKERGLPFTPINGSDVASVISTGARDVDEVLTSWLILQPALVEVIEVLAVATHSNQVGAALTKRTRALDPAERQRFYLEAVEEPDIDAEWFDAIVAADLDNDSVVTALAARMAAATASPARERIAAAVSPLALDSYSARHGVAQMARDLLAVDPNQSKSDVAARLVELLEGNYGLKQQLKNAAGQADGAGKVSKRARKMLEKSGMIKKRRTMVDQVVDQIFGRKTKDDSSD